MIRSLPYVPASAKRFAAKAHLHGADTMILDLEDAIPPDGKMVDLPIVARARRRIARVDSSTPYPAS